MGKSTSAKSGSAKSLFKIDCLDVAAWTSICLTLILCIKTVANMLQAFSSCFDETLLPSYSAINVHRSSRKQESIWKLGRLAKQQKLAGRQRDLCGNGGSLESSHEGAQPSPILCSWHCPFFTAAAKVPWLRARSQKVLEASAALKGSRKFTPCLAAMGTMENLLKKLFYWHYSCLAWKPTKELVLRQHSRHLSSGELNYFISDTSATRHSLI